MEECPVNRLIPIYLIVGGVFGFIQIFTNVVQRIIDTHKEDTPDSQHKTHPMRIVIYVFLVVWFVIGKNQYNETLP